MNCFVRVLLTMMPVDRPLASDWKVSVWSGEETYHTLYSLLQLLVAGKNMFLYKLLQRWSRKTLDWEGALARFHNFLEIANVGEAYLIFEKISVLPKVFSTNSPKRLKTLSVFSKHFLFWQNTFQKCFESVLPQNTFVFCHTPNNCYHICTIRTLLLCK